MTDQPQTIDWYRGIVTPVLAWGAIGIISGAGWLALVVPSRLGQVDSNQRLILSQLNDLNRKLEVRDATYSNLRDRVLRLEAGMRP